MPTFADIVEAADNLSVDEQETLLWILRRRLAERNRVVLAREVAESQAEFASGRSQSVTVQEIMDEIRSEP